MIERKCQFRLTLDERVVGKDIDCSPDFKLHIERIGIQFREVVYMDKADFEMDKNMFYRHWSTLWFKFLLFFFSFFFFFFLSTHGFIMSKFLTSEVSSTVGYKLLCSYLSMSLTKSTFCGGVLNIMSCIYIQVFLLYVVIYKFKFWKVSFFV